MPATVPVKLALMFPSVSVSELEEVASVTVPVTAVALVAPVFKTMPMLPLPPVSSGITASPFLILNVPAGYLAVLPSLCFSVKSRVYALCVTPSAPMMLYSTISVRLVEFTYFPSPERSVPRKTFASRGALFVIFVLIVFPATFPALSNARITRLAGPSGMFVE